MEKKNKRNEAGFTLIELMVVIVILGVLAGLVVPRIMGRPEQARMQKAEVQIESLETACKLFKLDTGSYPSSLEALVSGSGRKGGYLEKGKVPLDPWGNNYQYSSGSDDVEIWTTAKDGTRISNMGSDGGGSTEAGGHISW